MANVEAKDDYDCLKDDITAIEFTASLIAKYRATPAHFYGGALSHSKIDHAFVQEMRKLLDHANIPFELDFSTDDTTPKVSYQFGAATSWDPISKAIVYRPLCLSANKV